MIGRVQHVASSSSDKKSIEKPLLRQLHLSPAWSAVFAHVCRCVFLGVSHKWVAKCQFPKEHSKLCTPRCPLSDRLPQEFVVEVKRTGSLYKMLPSLQKLPMEHLVVVLSSIKNRILQCRFSVLSKQKKRAKNHSRTSIYENISTNTSNNTPETFENGIRKSKCRNVESSTKHIQTTIFWNSLQSY